MRKFRTTALGSAASLAIASPAFAQQDAAAEDESAQTSGNVIIVTARKTEERLQDVPLAIAAFNSEDIRERQVRDLNDISKFTPGLNFEAYLGSAGTPVIRGASQQRITDLDQNVSTFFDGIYLPRSYVINPGVIGLERVEVVKGPQSALYGRNAFSGAINYVSRRPGNEWRGSVEGTVGIYERLDAIAEVGGPLVEDKLFIQIGAGYSTFDGDQLNGHPNADIDISPGSPGRLGGWENKSFQGRLVFTPTETLSLDFGAYHFDTLVESPAVIQRKRSDGDAIGATNCGAILGGNPAFFCGELPFRFQPLPGGAEPSVANVDPRNIGLESKSTILVGQADWEAADDLTFSYDYGYVKSDAISGGSSDTDPVLGTFNPFNPTVLGNQFQISPVGDVKYWSHEMRAEYSPTGGLNVMIGGIYSRLNDFDTFPLSFGLPLLDTQPYDLSSPDFITLTRVRSIVKTKAIFGRINWEVIDQLRLGVEARYQWEDKTVTSGPTTFNPTVSVQDGDWKQFTPRFTADYRVSEDSMLYISVANGKKAGGFNGAAFVEEEKTFDPDNNWTYEIGTKNTFANGAITLNAALFYIDWNNRQVSVTGTPAPGSPPGITGPALIGNAGKSSVKGFEIDTVFAVNPNINLRAGFSYNDAKYDDGVIDTRLRDIGFCDDVACPADGDVGGNQLERQSKVQGLLGADFNAPISGAIEGFGGLDVSYKSKQYADSVNLAFLPSRTLVDARAGIRGDNWSLTMWAKNLFNKQYAASSFAIFFPTETVYVPIKGANRTVGLTGRFDF
ncbi:TonB-dependent receptor [Altererythrobacter sp. GH1-8]|uniref:TonB-dependent receptor n=1 Tax=Altererythrobacter sp. GH1-8 TaxID=3349333 RepID=UPI00374D23F6